MWERTAERIVAKGGRVEMRTRVERVLREDSRVVAIELRGPGGEVRRVEADHFINSMALRDLVECIDPPPPAAVIEAARALRYRDFLIVTLVLDKPDPFPDNWIYVHSPQVRVGRIQNFRAWSREMLPNDRQASIGMEYFCQQHDELWDSSDDELHRQGVRGTRDARPGEPRRRR